MLSCTGLHKTLAGKKIFSDLSCEFPGPVSVLEGANGSGKTTLLRMITGVMAPDQGEIRWGNRQSRECLTSLGHCPADEGSFYATLTVRQNLEFFATLYGIRSKELPGRIKHLSPFALDFIDLPVERCSLGMRQKVKITRSLLHDPGLLLLDEPLNGLDSASREEFHRWLESRRAEKAKLTLLVQHGFAGPFPKFRLSEGRIAEC